MKKKNLQKFTVSADRVDEIFQLKTITKDDLAKLNEEEYSRFFEMATEKLNDLKGIERDKFLTKIEPITVTETKNQLWEYNNNRIMNAILEFIQNSGYMPHQSEIASKTGLTRQTIHKHLKELNSNELFQSHMSQFKFMLPKLLGTLMKMAVNGDVKATRLLLEYTVENPRKITTQNNYIQINGLIYTEEKLKQLPAEQLNQIETILKTADVKTIECSPE